METALERETRPEGLVAPCHCGVGFPSPCALSCVRSRAVVVGDRESKALNQSLLPTNVCYLSDEACLTNQLYLSGHFQRLRPC